MKKFLLIFLILALVGTLLLFLLRMGIDTKNSPAIKGLPVEVSEFLTKQDIDKLESSGFPVHFGLNPPNIEGIYLTNSIRVDYDKMKSMPLNTKIRDLRRTFSNQTSQDYKITFGANSTSGNYVRKSQGGYISGDSDRFTVYQKMVNYWDGTVTSTTAELISGRLDKNKNIVDYKIAILMTNIKYPYTRAVSKASKFLGRRRGNPMPKDNIRILSERDGLAKRIK